MAHRVTAFAPATVANVAVGFDILGFALDGVGDRVTAEADPDLDGIRIESIRGTVTDLPLDPAQNTAGAAVAGLWQEHGGGVGLRLSIEKGIPLGSGMGGSAASAVAAVVAASRLLGDPLDRDGLLPHSLEGERVASGAAHADNAAPSLFGGLTAVVASSPVRVIPVPVPEGIRCALVHPHLTIETRQAREALPESVPLSTAVGQSVWLTRFLAGCFTGDRSLIDGSLVDLLAEPARSRLIPGFDDAREAARATGALGMGIAGSGPSVFAWCPDEASARTTAEAMAAAFEASGLEADRWVSVVGGPPARVESEEGRP